MTTMQINKVGLMTPGDMGQAVAQRMLGLGHEVWVYNRNPSRADALPRPAL